MTTTSIEWTDATWNPVTGCSKVSAGCKNCYAERIALRWWGTRKFTDVQIVEHKLHEPLRRKKATRYFVNSMSDLFHEDVPFDFIARVWAVCSEASQHTFQILTKRPQRMIEFAKWMAGADDISIAAWPRNVWLGVSVENQKYADERIPILLQVPCAVRFLSVEPMLEAISLKEIIWNDGEGRILLRPLEGYAEVLDSNSMDIISDDPDNPRINWVICGGESGPGARPFSLDWANSLRLQCSDAGVPFFMKQVGSFPVMDEGLWRERFNPIDTGRPTGLWLSAHRDTRLDKPAGTVAIALRDSKGGDMAEWPESMRVRQFPQPEAVSA